MLGYRNIYQISNLGRIKSIDRTVEYNRYGRICKRPVAGRLMLLHKQRGYRSITLCKNRTERQIYVHRLVGYHFKKRVPGKYYINHINGIKHDNRAVNIEWVTASENIQHSVDTGLARFNPARGGRAGKARKVLDTKTGKIFDTIIDAAKAYGTSVNHMRDMLSGIKTNKTGYKKI